jgi:uncharacterized protein (TIRG00374 family)
MRKFWLYFLIANVIGVIFLWLAARELPVEQAWGYLADSDPVSLAMAFAVFLVVYAICHGSRIARWYNLVAPLGDIDRGIVTRVCIVGFTAILLLPLRLGEFVRPYLLARKTELPMSSVLGTAVVERVIDGLCVTGLLFATLATYEGAGRTETVRAAGLVSAAIFVPALSISLLAMWRREWTVSCVVRLGSLVSQPLAEKLAAMLDAFIVGLSSLRSGGNLAAFLAWTVVYWTTNVGSMWLLATMGFGLEVGPWEMATVMSVLVVGIMIPAGPAMAGNFEYFVVMGLALFVGLAAADSGARVGAFAATLHVLQFLVIVLPGFLVMWLDPDSRDLVAMAEQASEQAAE